jgi:hypothetical protein
LAPTIPENLQVSKNQSHTNEMDSWGSLEVLIVNISIGTKISDSLRVSIKTSQNNKIVFLKSLEVKNIIISIDTKNSWKPASASQVPSRKC